MVDQLVSSVPRRALVLGGLAAGLLAGGCGSGSASPGAATSGNGPGPSVAAANPAAPAPSTASGASADGAAVTVAAADVPVGGGVVVDKRVVVTQPSQGEYRAFSAVCTHRGCVVGQVVDRQIVCPCHGSHFSVDDGSVVSGPAGRPLPAVQLEQQGSTLVVGG